MSQSDYFLAKRMRQLGLPTMGMAQARCLLRLREEPMAAVRVTRGWRAPDVSVGPLIRAVLVHFIPSTGSGGHYALTQTGRERAETLWGDKVLREALLAGGERGSESKLKTAN